MICNLLCYADSRQRRNATECLLRGYLAPTESYFYCLIHAGGKFGQVGYEKSGRDSMRVVQCLLTALSKWLKFILFRDGENYMERFEDGNSWIPR